MAIKTNTIPTKKPLTSKSLDNLCRFMASPEMEAAGEGILRAVVRLIETPLRVSDSVRNKDFYVKLKENINSLDDKYKENGSSYATYITSQIFLYASMVSFVRKTFF